MSGDMGDSAMLSPGGESVGEDQGGLWLVSIWGVRGGGVKPSDFCESGSCGLAGESLDEGVNTVGENSRPDFPSSLDLRLSSLFFFSVSESLGFSVGRSRGMDFGGVSTGMDLVDGQGGEFISGESGVSRLMSGERGVSRTGESGVSGSRGVEGFLVSGLELLPHLPLSLPGLMLLPHLPLCSSSLQPPLW